MASSNQPENPTNAKMNSFQQYATTKNYDDDRGLLKIEEAEDDMYSYPTFLQQNQHSNLRRRRKRQHNKKQSQLHQERHLRHHPRSYGQRSYHRKSRANQVVSGWVRVARACMNAILSTSKKIFPIKKSNRPKNQAKSRGYSFHAPVSTTPELNATTLNLLDNDEAYMYSPINSPNRNTSRELSYPSSLADDYYDHVDYNDDSLLLNVGFQTSNLSVAELRYDCDSSLHDNSLY